MLDKNTNEKIKELNEHTQHAENLASVFYVLKNSSFGKILNDEQLLFASGILNSSDYLKKGLLTYTEIKNAIFLAKKNVCQLENFQQIHRNFKDEENEASDLIGFAMQLECLHYYIDTKIEIEEIVNFVSKKKENIILSILKTLEQGQNNNLEKDLIYNVNAVINDTYFKNLVINYQLL